MATFLYVSGPVASLQFDIDASSTVQLEQNIHKAIATAQVDGKTRVVSFSLDSTEFSGKFAVVTGKVHSITNVIGARADGSDAHASVTKLSKIDNLILVFSP